MIATHEADCYSGKIGLCAVRPDPVNANMVFALVVKDHRYSFGHAQYLNTGSRVWIAAAQVSVSN